MIFQEDVTTALRDLVRDDELTREQAEAVAEKLGISFTLVHRQSVTLTVTVELDPEEDETDAEEVADRAVDAAESALAREFGYSYRSNLDVSLDSTRDA